MAMPVNYPTSVKVVPGGQLVDVSAASISYAPVPMRGVIVGAIATISAAVTGSDTTVTVKSIKGSTSTTIGTITIAVSGSAPGSTFLASMTGTEINRTVNQGDTIGFDSDGVSSTTSIANFDALLRQ